MWKCEHSVECKAGRAFAWQFWTDVDNWAVVDPGIDSVSLDGPFAAGSRGTTKSGGQPPIIWQITEAEDGRRALIEVAVPGAVAKFLWTFADAEGGGSRITQQASIEGEQADQYVQTVGKEIENGLPPGMQRLVDAIEEADDKG